MPPAKKEVRPSSRGGRARTPAFVKNQRGVKNWKEVSAWLEWRGIEDIECITPDQAGVARGKMMPSKKFTSNTVAGIAVGRLHDDDFRRLSRGWQRLPLSRGRRRPQADARPVDADGCALGRRPDGRRSSATSSTRMAARSSSRRATCLKRVVAALRQARPEAGGGARDRILPGAQEPGSGLSADPACRPLGPRESAAVPAIRSPASTSSTN